MSYDDRIVQCGSGVRPIILDDQNAKSYQECSTYDSKYLHGNRNWHQITVYHKGRLKHMTNGTELILDAIYAVVDHEEFFPVAYRTGSQFDTFLVRIGKSIIDKFFANSLRIQIASGPMLLLKIILNVAAYEFGQILPGKLLTNVVFKLLNSLVPYDDVDGVLNLSYFSERPEFEHIVINLGNTAVFKLVCNLILECDRFRYVNGLLLRGNKIRTIAPLQKLALGKYKLIDLTDNCIKSIERFCRDVKSIQIKAEKIVLAGNPIVRSPQYADCLREIDFGKYFDMVDNVPFERLSVTYTPMDYEVDIFSDGKRIDTYNKEEIRVFAGSQDWHAILIPDTTAEFTKDSILDYFFLMISPDLSEFYPCYYKYKNGEHSFIVRKCFDQLQYLAEQCQFEIKIPRLICLNGVTEVIFDRVIPFYMRMGISTYKKGQVEPLRQIEAALVKRFNVLGRVLNLNDFQSSDELDNVAVNMGSSKILTTILTIAGRKFIGNCHELRLGENKIVRFMNSNSLSFFTALKAIDLRNNWINELSDIEQLSIIPFEVLCLDGNPLCSKYKLPNDYIKAVRKIFPYIIRLDNADLAKNFKLTPCKNYLVQLDGYEFVEQFLQSYFRAFESADRTSLLGFYSKTAIFSMNFKYKPLRMSVDIGRSIAIYKKHSRNILKKNNGSRDLKYGPNEIISTFKQLPPMKHDFYSFHIDLPVFNANGLYVIYVTGIFKEEDTALENGLVFSFSRRFFMKEHKTDSGDGMRFEITNEIWTVRNPTSKQVESAFKYFSQEKWQETTKNEKISPKDTENFILLFQETTGLNAMWCNRCLEEAQWQFQVALRRFLDLQKEGKIPLSAWGTEK